MHNLTLIILRELTCMILCERAELRTILLLIICYSLIGLIVINPLELHLILQMTFLIPLITLHSSLQHEFLHGHPFKAQWINDLLVTLPVGLYLSYHRFKESHLKHHNNHILCDPDKDPESWYLNDEDWHEKSKFNQLLLTLNNTLLGRMLLGPTLGGFGFIFSEITNGNNKVRLTWMLHFFMAGIYVWALYSWGNIPIWAYIVCSYFGLSLLMVRTFLEHQADTSPLARSVIIEKKGFFSFLFLNNNFHAIHHAYPKLAWYRIPALFERNRDRFLSKNKGYYYKSYWEIFARYMFQIKEPVIYPLQKNADR